MGGIIASPGSRLFGGTVCSNRSFSNCGSLAMFGKVRILTQQGGNGTGDSICNKLLRSVDDSGHGPETMLEKSGSGVMDAFGLLRRQRDALRVETAADWSKLPET